MQRTKLRTKETYDRYEQDRKNTDTHAKKLDNPEDIVEAEYSYWKIIQNNYPYDAVAAKHDMLIPKRVFSILEEATQDELTEYHEIIEDLNARGVYDALQINFSKNRSILAHFHIHLLVWRKI